VVRRVYLLRHAKSSWDDHSLADHERPLAKRGRRAGKLMERHFRAENVRPRLVLCSTATRARETFDLVQPALDDAHVELEPELYGATEDTMLERLRDLPDDVDSVMLIGHNPGLQSLGLLLAGDGGRRRDLEKKYPTAALATLDFDGAGWAELAPGSANLTAYVKPRELEGD
jgi:phosphohistidine phosphatase